MPQILRCTYYGRHSQASGRYGSVRSVFAGSHAEQNTGADIPMTDEEFDNYQDMKNPNGHPDRIKGNVTPLPQPEPVGKGELEYGSITSTGDWRLRKFNAGMGETEYRIFKNGIFFAQFDNWEDAVLVMGKMIHQPERDTVLDAVMAVVDQYIPFGDSPTAIMVKEIYEAKKKAELRQQAGEP
jgi:hypothetical protein